MKYRIVTLVSLFQFLACIAWANTNDRKLVLQEFTVLQSGTKTDIKWTLNREPQGTYFTIEKSQDGKAFTKLIDMPVTADGNLFEEYFETDYQPYKGVSYYRIKQTDEAGNVFYSEMVAFKYNEEQSERLYAGLPQNDLSFRASVRNAEGREGLYVLRDSDGNDHYSKVNVGEENNYLYAIWSSPQLAPGIYRIVGSSNNQLYSLKLVIK